MKNQSSRYKIFYWVVTVIIAIEIFLFSNITSMPGKVTGLNLATLYHFAIFFAFTFFLTLSIKTKQLDYKTVSIIFLISLFYAISDEVHQIFVIGRFASIKDVLVDVIGSSFALLTMKVLERFNKI